MSHTNLLEEIKVESVFHPSDFSQASEVAFAHALKIALVAKATLTVLHVQAGSGTEGRTSPASATHSSDGGSSRKEARRAPWRSPVSVSKKLSPQARIR